MKKLIRILVLFYAGFLLSINSIAQINPIPRFANSLYEGEAYRIHTEIIKKANLSDSKNKLELDSIEIKSKTVDSEDALLIKNVIASLHERDVKSIDTLIFTKTHNTIYVHVKKKNSNRKNVRVYRFKSIDDRMRLEYKQYTKEYTRLQTEYNTIIKKIDDILDSTMQPGEMEMKVAPENKKRKSLYDEMEIISYKLDSIDDEIFFNMKSNLAIFPVVYAFYQKQRFVAPIFNKYYYGRNDISILQSLDISRGLNQTNVNAEVANGFFRTFRFSLAMNLNKVDDSDTLESTEVISDYQALMNNGGQLALRTALPMMFYRNKQDDISCSVNFYNRFGFDVIPDDPAANHNNVNNYVGFDFAFNLRTAGDVFQFFAVVPMGYTFGNSTFYSSYDFRDFSLIQLQAGVTIQKQLRIKFSGPLYSTQKSLQNVPWTIGFQFTPPQNGK